MVKNTTHTQTSIYLHFLLTKSTTRRVNASVLISELKHRPTQCLCLVRSKLTVTIQYVTSGSRYYNTIRSVIHLFCYLLFLLPVFILHFDNGRTITSNYSEGPGGTSVLCSTSQRPSFTYVSGDYVQYRVPGTIKFLGLIHTHIYGYGPPTNSE